jgi:hypothetical protein
LEPQLQLNSYGISAHFFPGQRYSAAINGTDYRICDPNILESSDDLETEHRHHIQNNRLHNE